MKTGCEELKKKSDGQLGKKQQEDRYKFKHQNDYINYKQTIFYN